MKQQKKALIILGMHNSGISTLSECINIFHQNSKDSNNKINNHEYNDITLLHDILLRNLGCKWDMIGSLPQNWLERDETKDARKKIAEIIKQHFTDSNLLFIKDPRLCRLIPMWMGEFKQNNIEPLFIHIIRHPFEVAQSLNEYENFDMMKSHLLWLNYNRDAMSATRENKNLIITYDSLLADPITCLNKIFYTFGFDFPPRPETYYSKIIDHVSSDNKPHNISELNDNKNKIYTPYAWIYNQLRLYHIKQNNTDDSNKDSGSSLNNSNIDNDIVKSLPLLNNLSKDVNISKSEMINASDVFDNMLSIISKYEQADLNRDIQHQRLLLTADHNDGTLYTHIFVPFNNRPEDYEEYKSEKILLAHNEWQKLSIPIHEPELLRIKPIRIIPMNRKGMAKISAINLMAVSGEKIWSLSEETGFQDCEVQGDSLLISNTSTFEICITGQNQYIVLPTLSDLPDVPVVLEIWIKVKRELVELKPLWCKKEEQLTNLNKKNTDIESRLIQSEKEWNKSQQELESNIQQQEKEFAAQTLNLNKIKEQHAETINELNRQNQDQKNEFEHKFIELNKKLNDSQSKLTQKEVLIEEYFSELAVTESRYKDEIALLNSSFHEQKNEFEQKILEQNENLNDVQSKLTQKEALIEEYFSELAVTESRYKDEITLLNSSFHEQKNEFEQKILGQNENLNDVQSKLTQKEALIEEYFSELAVTESRYKDEITLLNSSFHEQKNEFEQKILEQNENLNAAQRKLTHKETLIEDYFSELGKTESRYNDEITLLNSDFHEQKNEFDQKILEQNEKLNDARRKLTHKEALIEDYFSELAVTESRYKDEITLLNSSFHEQKNEFEQKILEQNEKLNDARRKLTHKEALIEDYFTELAETENRYSNEVLQLSSKLNDRQKIISNQIQQIKEKDEKLAQNISEYEKSKAFYHANFNKLGYLLGTNIINDTFSTSSKKGFLVKPPVDEIQSIFKNINDTIPTANSKQFSVYRKEEILKLKDWIQTLNRESKVLIRSVRWPIGNYIVFFLTLGLSKFLASDPMKNFSKLVQENDSQTYLYNDSYESLMAIIFQVQLNFETLIDSHRWRIGHKAVIFYRLIQFKKNPTWATYRIKKILNQFNNRIPFSSKNLLIDPKHKDEEIRFLKTSIQRLNRESKVLVKSVRWPIGNGIALFLTLGLSKLIISDPMKNMSYMVKSIDSQLYSDKHTYESLTAQINKIRQNVESLTNSYRWKTGHKAVIFYRIIQFKKNPPWATHRIKMILNQFDA